MSRPTSRLTTERDLRARAGWVSLTVALIAGMTLVLQGFVAQENFWGLRLPAWSTLAGLAGITLFFAWRFARARGLEPRRVFGVLGLVFFTPVLAVMLWIFTFMREPATPQLLFALLWATCFSSVLFDFVPHLFADTQRWRRVAASALAFSTGWAALVRFDLLADSNFFMVVLTATFWLCVLRWLPFQSAGRVTPSAHFVWLGVLGIVILWGSWVRIASVDSFAFQGDEYFHLNTAMGYLETEQLVQWDFLLQEPQWEKPYTRAGVYTWQVAQSIDLFGLSEWSVRLPALLWGILLLLLLPLSIVALTRSYALAFFSTALVAADPTLIWLSTFSRMYSMLSVLTIVAIALFCLCIAPPRGRRTPLVRWVGLVGSILLAILSAIFVHKVAILLVGGFGLALLVKAIWHPSDRWYQRALMATGLGLVSGIILNLVRPFFDLSFVAVRFAPAWEYPSYFGSALVLTSLGLTLLVGLLWIPKARWPVLVYTALAVVLPITGYFTFFADRYSAKKYFVFVLPLAYIVIAYLWRELSLRLFPAQTWRLALSTLAFLWLLIPVSLPGWQNPFLLKPDRSVQSYTEVGLHDYPTVYEYIERTAGTGEAVVLMGTKTYYLHRTDLDYYSTTIAEPMGREQLIALTVQYEHGWVVLSHIKKGELPRSFRRYVENNFHEVKALRPTNFRVYQW